MRKYLSVVAVSLLASSSAFANTSSLDANAIKHIHGQTVISFTANCKKTLTGNADAICSCLAGKANDYLDDDALSQCANDDTGMSCVSKLVASASTNALSQDNVAACTQTVAAASTATTMATTTTITTATAPDGVNRATTTPPGALATTDTTPQSTTTDTSTSGGTDNTDTNDSTY